MKSDYQQSSTLVGFGDPQSALAWYPVGDAVMGGQSDGALTQPETGHAHFFGTVRLDNGGGFASVKADLPEPMDVSDRAGIELLAWGDGRTYKVGLRNSVDRRSIVYQQAFTPDSLEWSLVRLEFSDFIPTWRGKTLPDADPLNLRELASLSLFVSGRQAGAFHLRMQNWTLTS